MGRNSHKTVLYLSSRGLRFERGTKIPQNNIELDLNTILIEDEVTQTKLADKPGIVRMNYNELEL